MWILSYSPFQVEFENERNMSYGHYLHYVKGIVCNQFFFTDFIFVHSEEE